MFGEVLGFFGVIFGVPKPGDWAVYPHTPKKLRIFWGMGVRPTALKPFFWGRLFGESEWFLGGGMDQVVSGIRFVDPVYPTPRYLTAAELLVMYERLAAAGDRAAAIRIAVLRRQIAEPTDA
jgi:hypothetical protein